MFTIYLYYYGFCNLFYIYNMAYSETLRKQALRLRRNGDSILSIARQLNIAKSTVSLWVRDVPLSSSIQKYLTDRSSFGLQKALCVLRAKRLAQRDIHKEEARNVLSSSFSLGDKNFWKLCAALLFWCEGNKHLSDLRFTNSDPLLIRLFLTSLSTGFITSIKRFRAVVHLHKYHIEKDELHFWSQLTGIPLNQFYKSYLKEHTGIRKRAGYHGCISIRYGDASIARRLDALYHALATYVGP